MFKFDWSSEIERNIATIEKSRESEQKEIEWKRTRDKELIYYFIIL